MHDTASVIKRAVERWLDVISDDERVRVTRRSTPSRSEAVWEVAPAIPRDSRRAVTLSCIDSVLIVELGEATVLEFYAEPPRGMLGPAQLLAVLDTVTYVGFRESVWVRDGEVLRSRARIVGYGVDVSPTHQLAVRNSSRGGQQIDRDHAPLIRTS